jgi:hypothetical protein
VLGKALQYTQSARPRAQQCMHRRHLHVSHFLSSERRTYDFDIVRVYSNVHRAATAFGIPEAARIETSYTRVNMWRPHTRPRGLHMSVASSLAPLPRSAHFPTPKGSFNDIVEPPRLLCDPDWLSDPPITIVAAVVDVANACHLQAQVPKYKYQRRPVLNILLKHSSLPFCSLPVLP